MKVWNGEYEYDESVYTGATDEIWIRCKKHGLFKQRACDHLSGYGCQKCGYEKVSNFLKNKPKSEEHIQKLIDRMINSNTNFNYKSKTEQKFIDELIKPLNIHFIQQYWFKDIHQLSDVYIPSLNSVIEFEGDFWHCNPKLFPNGAKYNCQKEKIKKDKIKYEYFDSKNIKYLRVWENDYRNNLNLVKEEITRFINNQSNTIQN